MKKARPSQAPVVECSTGASDRRRQLSLFCRSFCVAIRRAEQVTARWSNSTSREQMGTMDVAFRRSSPVSLFHLHLVEEHTTLAIGLAAVPFLFFCTQARRETMFRRFISTLR